MYDFFKEDQKLSNFSTLGIGGSARYFLEVRDVELMQKLFAFLKKEKLPYFILGKGSNCLFSDSGFDGLVILNKIDFCSDDGLGNFYVGAGASFANLGIQSAKKGFSGLEFAAGIPASVGGAIFMNAGASTSETQQTVQSVDYIDENGDFYKIKKEEISFSYRSSSFQKMKGVIVGTHFLLTPLSEARELQLKMVEKRVQTQPYNEKSIGCIFKNPQNSSAGFLIEKSGLKGFQIGGAQVSEKHANFLINKEGASAQDMIDLIDHVRSTVSDVTGFHLEPEIRIVRN